MLRTSVLVLDTCRDNPTALLFATGSEKHLDQLRILAEKQGLILDESGLYRDGKLVAARTEEEIYGALGLPFIEPELREGRGEMALARKKQLPKLVRASKIFAASYMHTPMHPME